MTMGNMTKLEISEITAIPVDYHAAYTALAHRVKAAQAYAQHCNSSAVQTLLNECSEVIRMVESPMVYFSPNPKGHRPAADELNHAQESVGGSAAL